MKKFLKNKAISPEAVFIFSVFTIWKFFFFIVEKVGPRLVEKNSIYAGTIPWANFDGVHYLLIAEKGYQQYQQAFFPLFPLLLKDMYILFYPNYYLYIYAGQILVNIFFLFALFIFYKLVRLDFSASASRWSVVFLAFFPTAFFFNSLYTESIFLLFTLASFLAARNKKWFIASALAGLASATRLVGIFLLPALLLEFYQQRSKRAFREHTKNNIFQLLSIILLSSSGLFSYMAYLWNVYGDPFLFIHVQPFFGAERSGNTIILLPQVLFRYIKIFLSLPPTTLVYWIAVLEFILLIIFLIVIVFKFKKVRISYLAFSVLSILLPTLSGTLSSIPRYMLVAFPLFFILAASKRTSIKILILGISLLLLGILAIFYSRGHFIA